MEIHLSKDSEKSYIANPPPHHAICFWKGKDVKHMITLHTDMFPTFIHEVPEIFNSQHDDKKQQETSGMTLGICESMLNWTDILNWNVQLQM